MERFNINNVIDYYKLDVDDIAKVMFPNIKYPKQAFDRILKGEADLSITQVENLASHIGVLVTDLFSANTWKSSIEDGCIILERGEYKAKLNYNGVYLSIYKNTELLEQRISNVPSMTTHEFISYITNIVKRYKNYENGTD